MQIWVQWLELTPCPKECRIWEVCQKLFFEDGGVQKPVLPLIFGCNHFGAILSVSFFCRAKEAKTPAHGTHQAALPLFRSCLCGNILQSVASLVARAFSSVFRVLRNSFSYPHFVCITHTQTVIAFGELWLHSLCNLQVYLRYARLHKPSHLIRKTDGLSAVMLTVPVEF